jgi:hypothetical protein
MDQHTTDYNYQPLRKGERYIEKNDGSFPPKDASPNDVFLTASLENYHMVTTGDIRILELDSGSFNDPLSCQLVVYSLESYPKYDALSYMWGDSSLTGSIFLDYEPFPVTRSLENALRHVRLRDNVRYIWADAVCINQQDEEERGNQIHLMKEIYSRSNTVRVWIDIELSLEDPVVRKLFTLRLQDAADQLGEDPEFWRLLLPLLQNEYWDRLWIQQELVFAPKLVFHCRGVTIPGNCLMALQLQISRKLTGGRDAFDTDDPWSLFRPLESTIKAPSRNLACWRAMMKNKVPVDPLTLEPDLTLLKPKAEWKLDPRKMSSHLSTSPIYLLGMLRQSQALKITKAEDRVRAVLNLVIDYDDDGYEADCKRTVTEWYLRIAQLLPSKCNSLLFLAMAKTSTNSNDNIQGLPSWAPNWSSPANAEYFLGAFHAAGDLPMYGTPFQGDIEHDILHVRGFKYATVDRVPSTTDNALSPLSNMLSLFISTVKSTVYHYGDVQKLGNILTGPAMAELRIPRDYFSEMEAVIYTGVLLGHSLLNPHLRIVDLLPRGTKVFDHSETKNRAACLILRKFLNFCPSCLRCLCLEGESDLVQELRGTTERFRQFIQLVHKTLSSGCLASIISSKVTPNTTPTTTFAITEGKALVRSGDEVWILFGCATPMVLRRTGRYNVPYFLVASPAYVSDVMNGEAMDGVETPDDNFGGWSRVLETKKLGPSFAKPYVSGRSKWKVRVIRLR